MRHWRVIVVVLAVLALAACGGSPGSGSSSSAPTKPAAARLATMHYSGTGDDVIDVSGITGKAYTKATLTHDGKRNFIVRPLLPDGSDMMSLVNEIGEYQGTVKWDKRAATLTVRADGAWKITVMQ